MADEPTTGELGRRVDRLESELRTTEAQLRAEHQADMQRLEREHDDDLRKLREDVIKPLQDRNRMSFGRWMAVIGAVIGFATLVVTAYAATKGAG